MDRHDPRMALLIDEFMAGIENGTIRIPAHMYDRMSDPEVSARFNRVRSSALGALQAAAASDNIRGEVVERRMQDIPDWIRLQALDTSVRWTEGTARTCMHSPSPRRDDLAFACAWKPGMVVCGQCIGMLRATGDADRICDRCGDLTDEMYPGSMAVGGLIFQFGVCGSCREEPFKTGH